MFTSVKTNPSMHEVYMDPDQHIYKHFDDTWSQNVLKDFVDKPRHCHMDHPL